VDPLVTALLEKLDLASKDSTRWPDLFLLEEQVTKQQTSRSQWHGDTQLISSQHL